MLGNAMAEPFLGQIIAVGFNFAPLGWELCNGQLITIADNTALFNLIGTTYGGDGQTTFGLPDLRGRVAISQGQGTGQPNYLLGQLAGSETVSLTANENAGHAHPLLTSSHKGTTDTPDSTMALAENDQARVEMYGTVAANTSLAAASITTASGAGQPHDNLQPFLVINYIIAVNGIYPSQN
jgi:microcystin-dependent protein